MASTCPICNQPAVSEVEEGQAMHILDIGQTPWSNDPNALCRTVNCGTHKWREIYVKLVPPH